MSAIEPLRVDVLRVDEQVRTAVEIGDIDHLKALVRGHRYAKYRIQEFLAMLQTKNSYSYSAYETIRDPLLITQRQQGIRRPHSQHVKIFSRITTWWFALLHP